MNLKFQQEILKLTINQVQNKLFLLLKTIHQEGLMLQELQQLDQKKQKLMQMLIVEKVEA